MSLRTFLTILSLLALAACQTTQAGKPPVQTSSNIQAERTQNAFKAFVDVCLATNLSPVDARTIFAKRGLSLFEGSGYTSKTFPKFAASFSGSSYFQLQKRTMQADIKALEATNNLSAKYIARLKTYIQHMPTTDCRVVIRQNVTKSLALSLEQVIAGGHSQSTPIALPNYVEHNRNVKFASARRLSNGNIMVISVSNTFARGVGNFTALDAVTYTMAPTAKN